MGKGSRRGGGGRRRPRGARSGGQGGGHAAGQGGGRKGGAAAVSQGPRKGKAFSTPYEVPETGPIAPFDLFCACLLGLMPDGSYRGAGLGEVAKRLRRSPNEVRDLLQSYGMDAETLKGVDFDLALAKLDIQVAPEGIDRRELARGLFEEFVEVHPTLEDTGPAVHGNGAGPESNGAGGPAPGPAHRHRKKAEAPPAPAAAEPEAEEPPEAAEAELVAAEPEAADEAEEAEVPAGEEAPAGPRPVRQIRRSPVRRGR